MITIYGRQSCQFCVKAKKLAETYDLEYNWIDTTEPNNLSELKEKLPDVKTIPQIWWDKKHIGGYTEFASEVENTIGGFGHGSL